MKKKVRPIKSQPRKEFYRIMDEVESRFADLKAFHLLDYEGLIKTNPLDEVAVTILEGKYGKHHFMQKDDVDRFIDFIYLKISIGYLDVVNMAFPVRRMNDSELEVKIIDLLNVQMYPEIVFHILKYFSRNIHTPDTNIYLANLVYSEEIIKSIYDTYNLFKKDIFISDPERKCLNVKRIQQFSAHSENKNSSPLDAAARLKYVLEFFASRRDYGHIFSKEDLMISKPVK